MLEKIDLTKKKVVFICFEDGGYKNKTISFLFLCDNSFYYSSINLLW
jgi:hypothetical protein